MQWHQIYHGLIITTEENDIVGIIPKVFFFQLLNDKTLTANQILPKKLQPFKEADNITAAHSDNKQTLYTNPISRIFVLILQIRMTSYNIFAESYIFYKMHNSY